MAGIIGLFFSLICIFGGFLIGEALFTVGGIVLALIGIVMLFVTCITAAFFPKFGYARYAIQQPEKAFEKACDATTPRFDIENDGLYALAELAMSPIKIKNRYYAKMTFEKLAESHYPHSAAMIGKFYKEGYACHRNYKKAVHWLQQAIEDGEVYYFANIWDARTGHTSRYPKYETDAYSDLAELYLYGQGVRRDEDKALELLSQSRHKGNEERFFYAKRAQELQQKNKRKSNRR